MTTIDQRGSLYNPQVMVGWPRDNRRLVLGIFAPEDYASAIRRIRFALRGKQDTVIVLHNYAVDGYAAIDP